MRLVVTMPAAMKLAVDTKLGSSKLDSPKIPWPLGQPPASRVPKPITSTRPNIQSNLPAWSQPIWSSKRPSAQVTSQPPPNAADSTPPTTNPASNGKRQSLDSIRDLRVKYGARTTSEQMFSKPVETPSRRLPT